MNIGRSIRVACAKKDIKQKALAELSGISEVTISSLVSGGKCKQVTLEALVAVFDMPVSEFIALGE